MNLIGIELIKSKTIVLLIEYIYENQLKHAETIKEGLKEILSYYHCIKIEPVKKPLKIAFKEYLDGGSPISERISNLLNLIK